MSPEPIYSAWPPTFASNAIRSARCECRRRAYYGGADAARRRELPHQRADRPAGARHRHRPHQEGGGARPIAIARPARRRPSRRPIVTAADEILDGAHARSIRRRRLPGRRRHLAQHERQRGARQPRRRDPRRAARQLHARPPERSRQHGTVDQRRVPDGDAAGDPASCCRTCWHRRATWPTALRREEPRVRARSSRPAARTCRTRCRSRSDRNLAATPPTSRTRPASSSARAGSCTS